MGAATSHWVHNLDPVLIQLGPVALRWYGLAYLGGLVCGWLLIRRWIRGGLLPMRETALGDLVLFFGLGMIVGARLGYALLYQPELWISWGNGFPWWGVLKIHQGGMSSHGGIVGMAVGTWLFWRKHRPPMLPLFDAAATAAPIGVVFGRIANFINGELWGRATTVPWAMYFPGAGLDVARHPSQLYAALLEGLFPLLVAWPVHIRHRRPGLSLALVLGCYAIGRFIGEFYREPDAGYDLFFGWMSKGQLYSIPVLLVALWLGVSSWRRGTQPQCYPRSAAAEHSPTANSKRSELP